MFYVIRVNNALALLGVDPRVFATEYRQMAQDLGKLHGLSPQEVALIIVAQLPLTFRFNASPSVARAWVRKRKINPRDRQVKDALYTLGWFDLAEQ